MKERDMRPAVDVWLRQCGCQVVVYEALPPSRGYVDVLGAQFDLRLTREIPEVALIAVELKLCRIAEVIRQASRNRQACMASYAAMPAAFCARMTRSSRQKFRDAGVGLIAVDGDCAVLTILSRRGRLRDEAGSLRNYHKGLWRHVADKKVVGG